MLKTVLLFLINSFFLIALDLPTAVESSIVSISKDQSRVGLSGNVPSGRAGVVIHKYNKDLQAITHSLISTKTNSAIVKRYEGLEHKNIPQIKTALSVGDRVIFGNLYNNLLLIAPNERVYRAIVKLAPNRLWIHPDLYAYYFIEDGEEKITIESLREFAKKSLIGLVAIVAKDGLRILDPISGRYLRRVPINIELKSAQLPFYARFEGIDDIFTKPTPNNLDRYFKMVEEIR